MKKPPGKRFDTPLKIVRWLKFRPNDRLLRETIHGEETRRTISWCGTHTIVGFVTAWALREAMRLKWLTTWTTFEGDTGQTRFYRLTRRGDNAAGERRAKRR